MYVSEWYLCGCMCCGRCVEAGGQLLESIFPLCLYWGLEMELRVGRLMLLALWLAELFCQLQYLFFHSLFDVHLILTYGFSNLWTSILFFYPGESDYIVFHTVSLGLFTPLTLKKNQQGVSVFHMLALSTRCSGISFQHSHYVYWMPHLT